MELGDLFVVNLVLIGHFDRVQIIANNPRIWILNDRYITREERITAYTTYPHIRDLLISKLSDEKEETESIRAKEFLLHFSSPQFDS